MRPWNCDIESMNWSRNVSQSEDVWKIKYKNLKLCSNQVVMQNAIWIMRESEYLNIKSKVRRANAQLIEMWTWNNKIEKKIYNS